MVMVRRPQKLKHYSLHDAANGYVAALYFRSKGTRHFPAVLLKVSSSTSGANSLEAAAATTSGPDDTKPQDKSLPMYAQ
jgi:hypothetical protein